MFFFCVQKTFSSVELTAPTSVCVEILIDILASAYASLDIYCRHATELWYKFSVGVDG